MNPMWSKHQIRQARKIELVPLLLSMGLRLRPLNNGNTLVEDYPGLVVKQHFWTWPDRNIHGNAIDFLVLVCEKSFHQAMQILAEFVADPCAIKAQQNTSTVGSTDEDCDAYGTHLRRERGIQAKIQ